MSDDPDYETDFREHPEAYRIGRGEEGVFTVQPYKDELLPHWGFADEATATDAAAAIFERYESYKADEEFVGMDMARKYLQMGFTRAMRYAKYPGGKKYDDGVERDPQRWADAEKRAAAVVFKSYWDRVRDDDAYQRLKDAHREKHG
ncbi:DUF4385 domain-containing protein [Haloferacaceae archaeon DSL9]